MPTFDSPLLPATAGLALGSPSQPWTLYTEATIVATGPAGPQGPAGPVGATGATGPQGTPGPPGLASGVSGVLHSKGLMAFTGTGLSQLADSYTLPAGTLSVTGALKVLARAYNCDLGGVSVGAPFYLVFTFGGTGGTTYSVSVSANNATVAEIAMVVEIHNNGVLNSQFIFVDSLQQQVGSWQGDNAGLPGISAGVDFSQSQPFNLNVQQATGARCYVVGWSVARIG